MHFDKNLLYRIVCYKTLVHVEEPCNAIPVSPRDLDLSGEENARKYRQRAVIYLAQIRASVGVASVPDPREY